jgi:hypothetical protein
LPPEKMIREISIGTFLQPKSCLKAAPLSLSQT